MINIRALQDRENLSCPVLPCPARTGQDQVDKFLQVRLKFWKS